MTWLLRAVVALVIIFLLLPVAFVIISSFGASSMMAFPPTSFTVSWYTSISPEYISSLKVSLIVASFTALVSIILGTGVALAVVRGQFIGAGALEVFSLSPLMVPSLVVGVALFQFTGVIWSLTHFDLVGTITGLVIGHSICAVPYVVRSLIAAHSQFDHSLEEAALSLRAGRLRTLWSITLPVLMPGMISGGLFAFLISLDDLPVALFMSGGSSTTTLPVRIYSAIEYSLQPDIMAISSILIYCSFILILLLDRVLGIEKFFGGGSH